MLGLFPLKILVTWGREYLCSKVLYAQKLSEGTTEQPSMQSVSAGKQSETSLSQGWALRQPEKAAPFNANKATWTRNFLLDNQLELKLIHHRLHATFETHARTGSGKQRFSIDEFLTP